MEGSARCVKAAGVIFFWGALVVACGGSEPGDATESPPSGGITSTLLPDRGERDRYLSETLIPGRGFGDIRVGVANLGQVTEILGSGYRQKASSESSTQCYGGPDCETTNYTVTWVSYETDGLAFEFKQLAGVGLSPNQAVLERIVVECIHDRCPFQGATDKGIRLGDPRDKVTATYGRPKRAPHNSWLLQYRSRIAFGFDSHYLKDSVGERGVRSISVYVPEA